MNEINDDALRRALNAEAESFRVAASAKDRILDEATAFADEDEGALRHVTSSARRLRHRRILTFAASVVAVAVITVPLIQSSPNASRGQTTHGVTFGGAAQFTWNRFSGAPSYSLNSAGSNQRLGLGVTPTSSKTLSPSSANGPKIESNGTVDLTTRKGQFQHALESLSGLAARLGGYVASTQQHNGTNRSGNFSYADVVLQVPQRNFGTLVLDVQKIAHATNIQASSNDVTTQYVDLQSRITALQAGRRQYLAILARATTISDILTVQSRINDIQSQIDQAQGQFKALQTATTYASLSVDVSERGHHAGPPAHPHVSGLLRAWRDSVGGFVAGIEWLIRLAGPALFAVAMLGLLALSARFTWRRTHRRLI